MAGENDGVLIGLETARRMADVTRTVERMASPIQPYRRQRTSRSRGGVVVSGDAFQISLEVIEEVQYAKISSGVVFTDIQNFIPEGVVDLSSYNIGDTVYIYLKVANNWLNGTDLRVNPLLTVLSGTGTTNFYGNNSVFPLADFGNFFYQVGQVIVTDNGSGEPAYSVVQIANENATINPIELLSFSAHSFLKAKATDTETETQAERFVNKGFAKLPDNSNVELATSTETSNLATGKYNNLIIDSTLNADGFYENFTTSLEFNATTGTDTSTKLYFPIANFLDSTVTQYQTGNFVSDGRVW